MCLVWLVWLVWCDWCGSPLCEVPQSVDNWLVWRGGHSWSAGRPHTRARDQVGPGQGSVTSGEVPLPPSSPPPVSRHWGEDLVGKVAEIGLGCVYHVTKFMGHLLWTHHQTITPELLYLWTAYTFTPSSSSSLFFFIISLLIICHNGFY